MSKFEKQINKVGWELVQGNRDEAEKAINALSEKEIMGRPMKVNEARNLDKQVLNKD